MSVLNGASRGTSVVGDQTFFLHYGRATYRDRRFSLRIEHFRANEIDPPSTDSTYDLVGNQTSETTDVNLEFAQHEHALPPLTCLCALARHHHHRSPVRSLGSTDNRSIGG
ncbi:MAG: hypothetical protein AB7O52_13720 [Planctomycetota bacterium]